ncbi:F-box-like domain-containing protein [Criblamydia sequanensis]|uniref:F-box domain-containing protein n=1 Tax=Candidatus Criblamydia sequanensis CRIB-18 TaxID=1437425 RepID=A0A090CZ91_9BACT|nr:F-box protein [Criblamydia sequanensis]CDR34121.1 hypothetical protein CSEC_1301 [Criblamydia sequanensis CRIB-18]
MASLVKQKEFSSANTLVVSQTCDPLMALPIELLLQIFYRLGSLELLAASSVSRSWSWLSSALWQERSKRDFPSLKLSKNHQFSKENYFLRLRIRAAFTIDPIKKELPFKFIEPSRISITNKKKLIGVVVLKDSPQQRIFLQNKNNVKFAAPSTKISQESASEDATNIQTVVKCGKFIAASESYGRVYLFSSKRLKPIDRIKDLKGICSLAYNQKYLIAGTNNGLIYSVDLKLNKVIASVATKRIAPIWQLFSYRTKIVSFDEEFLSLWDLKKSSKVIHEIKLDLNYFSKHFPVSAEIFGSVLIISHVVNKEIFFPDKNTIAPFFNSEIKIFKIKNYLKNMGIIQIPGFVSCLTKVRQYVLVSLVQKENFHKGEIKSCNLTVYNLLTRKRVSKKTVFNDCILSLKKLNSQIIGFSKHSEYVWDLNTLVKL